MKKSKCDFKKLALLGIVAGTGMATQAVATDSNNYSQMLASNGCGGHGGCGGGSVGGKNGGQQAYRNVPSQGYSYGGCSGQSAPQGQSYQSSGGCGGIAPTAGCQGVAPSQGHYQASGGCGGYSAQSAGCQNTTAPQGYHQISTGCGAQYAPQGQSYQSQSSHGCSAATSSQGQSGQQGQQQQQQGQQQQQQGQQQQGQQQQGLPTAPTAGTPSAANHGAYTQWETKGYTADASRYNSNTSAPSATATKRTLTESELKAELNETSKKDFDKLDSTGKAFALKMANQDCKGQNDCKGLNSCKAKDHACAGKGSCAGTSESNFKDKNLAVKVAALKMAEKRTNAVSPK